MVSQTLGQASPSMSRLDRILELVTTHEECYRLQDMRLSELDAVMRELAPLKQRNVCRELDLARAAVEALVRQVTALTQTNQLLENELKAQRERQEQQQLAHETALRLLRGDVAELSSRLDSVRESTSDGLEQLHRSSQLQAVEQQQELETAVQSLQREASANLALLRQELSAQTSAAVMAVEGWTKDELLQLASKMKAVVAGCSNHQAQINLQMEALQLQWDNTSAALSTLQQEDRRLKKHVARLSQSTEEAQRLAQQAAGSEAAQQLLRSDVHQLQAAQQQLNARLEVSLSTSSSLAQKVLEVQQQLTKADSRLLQQGGDVLRLAEAAGSCLAAMADEKAAAPSSILSSLLAPAAAPGVDASSARKSSPCNKALDELYALLPRLRQRLQHSH